MRGRTRARTRRFEESKTTALSHSDALKGALGIGVGFGMVFFVVFGFGRFAFAVVSFALFAGSRSLLVLVLCVPPGGGFVCP